MNAEKIKEEVLDTREELWNKLIQLEEMYLGKRLTPQIWNKIIDFIVDEKQKTAQAISDWIDKTIEKKKKEVGICDFIDGMENLQAELRMAIRSGEGI